MVGNAYRKRYGRRLLRGDQGGFLGWLRNLSVVGWLIIITAIISIAVFFLIGFNCNPELGSCVVFDYFFLKPSSILQGNFLWTLILHMFVHGSLGHLFINMFVLFSLGNLSARIIGKKRFFWFYMLSGIFAGVLSVLLSGFFGSTELGARIFGSPDIFMVGASGAIFAIAGLYVVLLPKLKFGIIFIPFFSLPAYIMIPAALFIMWGLTILFNWPIGNVAHFGGFLAGLGYGYYLKNKYKRKVKMLQRMFK